MLTEEFSISGVALDREISCRSANWFLNLFLHHSEEVEGSLLVPLD